MDTLRVKRLRPGAHLPVKASPGATGLDLFACIADEATITLSTRPALVGTGIAVEIPPGYDAQVRPRSGLSAKGVGVTLGTIDSDYRGELMVTMHLLSPEVEHTVHHGDRIAQLVVSRAAELSLEEVEELSETERGERGHGSTGL